MSRLSSTAPKTFFEHQDEARRRSSWAVTGFLFTVLLTVGAVSLFAGFVSLHIAEGESQALFWPTVQIAAGFTLAIIFVSWAWRASVLAAGPDKVMRSMGGKAVDPDTADMAERRLLNLVEEMSLASGLPVPDVYLLEGRSINACAVGMETDQAAVGVTAGAMNRLSRDELQGVIAHEFSHILHGDMSLNTHMIAWLGGLFTVSEIGRILMDVGVWTSPRRSRSDKDDGAGLRVLLVMSGAGVWLLGSIGVFFGRWLQSAVSRQREFLADASSVQYTRNPEGLGNALRKLGSGGVRGRMTRPHVDCAHMMFSNLSSRNFVGIFSTHPPLPDRIRRVLPAWDGSFLSAPDLEELTGPPPLPPDRESAAFRKLPQAAHWMRMLQEQNLPDTARLEAASAWRASLPPVILEAAHQRGEAATLVYHLLLKGGTAGLELLPPDEREKVRNLQAVSGVNPADRLALVDLALPALRRLEPGEKTVFLSNVNALAEADGELDLFEFSLRRILQNALTDSLNPAAYQRMRQHSGRMEREINVMLSALSRLGADSEAAAGEAFARGVEHLQGFLAGVELRLLTPEECGLTDMELACDRLPGLVPAQQQRLMQAGLAAVSADGTITPLELEAFRAFAAALHIPVPPDLGFGAGADV